MGDLKMDLLKGPHRNLPEWAFRKDPENIAPPEMFRDVIAFHRKFGLAYNGEDPTPEEANLRYNRLHEEMLEFSEACVKNDHEGMLDGLVDLVYIALGTAYRMGWNFEEAWRRVHKANMAKERGTPQSSKYGTGFDIVKPEGWTPPNLSDLI